MCIRDRGYKEDSGSKNDEKGFTPVLAAQCDWWDEPGLELLKEQCSKRLESIDAETFDSEEVVEQVDEPDQKMPAVTPDVVRSFQGHHCPIGGVPRRLLDQEVPQTRPGAAGNSCVEILSDSD